MPKILIGFRSMPSQFTCQIWPIGGTKAGQNFFAVARMQANLREFLTGLLPSRSSRLFESHPDMTLGILQGFDLKLSSHLVEIFISKAQSLMLLHDQVDDWRMFQSFCPGLARLQCCQVYRNWSPNLDWPKSKYFSASFSKCFPSCPNCYISCSNTGIWQWRCFFLRFHWRVQWETSGCVANWKVRMMEMDYVWSLTNLWTPISFCRPGPDASDSVSDRHGRLPTHDVSALMPWHLTGTAVGRWSAELLSLSVTYSCTSSVRPALPYLPWRGSH